MLAFREVSAGLVRRGAMRISKLKWVAVWAFALVVASAAFGPHQSAVADGHGKVMEERSKLMKGMGADPKSETKDIVWEKWDDFTAAAGLLGDKAAALKTALASGDAGAVGAAFGDLGKKLPQTRGGYLNA